MRLSDAPVLHRYVDAQLNSARTVRRNVYHALLHAVAAGYTAARSRALRLRQPRIFLRCVEELLRVASAIARGSQRACCALPGAGLGAPATLLEPHEVVWLGAAALRTLLLHRPDPFGRAVQKLL